jgi:type IV secretion system protein VirD4
MVTPKVGAGGAPAKSESRRVPVASVVAMLAVLVIVGSAALTQYLAHLFDYDPGLGPPSFKTIYAPWKWFEWSVTFYSGYKPTFNRAYELIGSACASVFALYALFAGGLRRLKPSAMLDMYGTAHWADRDEIVQTGLLPATENAGVYVGGWVDKRGRTHYLRHNGPEHVMAFAPSRSGKGIGLVIPTLLSWPESVVVLDIKGENYALTAGWRKTQAKNVVLRFDPASPDGLAARFNPLDAIRMDRKHMTADVQNLVTMIVDPDGRGLNDHWAKTGHALLVGAVMHCLYKARKEKKKATLAGVLDLLSDTETPILDVLKGMREYEHTKAGPDPVVAACATDMLNKAPNEMSGVLSTSISFLTLYRDRTVKDNTAESDFLIRDLMHHDKPVSLYLVVSPADKDRLKPLLRLMVNQIVRILVGEPMEYSEGAATPQYKHRLLLLIDEFPSLGRLDIFQESLAFIAGYGLKAYLIVQDMAQLYSSYGKDESITSNCHIRVAFAPNKQETAEYLSKLSGAQTIVKDSVSLSGQRMATVMSQVSHHFVEHQRPLLTPDECMRLPGAVKDAAGKIVRPGDMLIFAAGSAPIYGRQILYFQDETFDARAKIAPPMETDRLKTREEGIEGETKEPAKEVLQKVERQQSQIKESGDDGGEGNRPGAGERKRGFEETGCATGSDSTASEANRRDGRRRAEKSHRGFGCTQQGVGGSGERGRDGPIPQDKGDGGNSERGRSGPVAKDNSDSSRRPMAEDLPREDLAPDGSRDPAGSGHGNNGDDSSAEVDAWNVLFAPEAGDRTTVYVVGGLSYQRQDGPPNTEVCEELSDDGVAGIPETTSAGGKTVCEPENPAEPKGIFQKAIEKFEKALTPEKITKGYKRRLGKIQAWFNEEKVRAKRDQDLIDKFIKKLKEAKPLEPVGILGLLGQEEYRHLVERWTNDHERLQDEQRKLRERLFDLTEFAKKIEIAGESADAEREEILKILKSGVKIDEKTGKKSDELSIIEPFWIKRKAVVQAIVQAWGMYMGTEARLELFEAQEKQKRHERIKRGKRANTWEQENERLNGRCLHLYQRIVTANRCQYCGRAEEMAEKILRRFEPEIEKELNLARQKRAEAKKKEMEAMRKNSAQAAATAQ